MKKLYLLLGVLFISLQSFAQYVSVTNTFGTSTYAGVSVTTTSAGTVSYATTCSPALHFWLTSPGDSYTFTFSTPVSSVRIPYINSGGGTPTTTHFIVNGAPYTLTGANFSGTNNTCFDATLNVIVGGDLTNTGDLTGFPNSQIDIPGPITSLTLQSIGGSNISAFQLLFPSCSPGSPVPAIIPMTGGGGYCLGGTGVNVGLAGSAVGVNYQLYLAGVPVGSPVGGVGAAFSFGLQTAAGVYTATATNSYGCTSTMSGSKTVAIYPLPNVQTVTGGGSYCAGGTGVAVGLASSDVGVNYQLYRAGLPVVGTITAGTGSALSFGLQTIAGVYTVVATMGGFTACTQNMSGSATITINPLPAAYIVTGGGSYCAGGTGMAVGLSNSDVGTNYQLYKTGVALGSPVAGTGAAISFGLQTAAGTYTVKATNTTTGCINNMAGSVAVYILPMPVIFTVTGGGGYCSGGAGANVGLSGSTFGVNYQLYLGGTPTGSPLPGTGSAISFGPQPTAGVYTVVATNASSGCTSNMSGSVTVYINPLPNVYTVTGGGAYCAGGPGVAIGLSNSDAGVNYQLYRGTTMVGGSMGGTGSAISFGLQIIAGTYTVRAYNPSTTCTNNMSGSATITIIALPAAITMTGGGGYCTGGIGVNIGLIGSSIGIDYQLYLGGTPVGGTVTGTGGALSFGLQTAAGTYTATGYDPISGCTNNMTGSINVYIYALPTAFTVLGGGSYCAGGTGVPIYLSGSQTGVSYQLYRGGLPVAGAIVAGTGSAISFGSQTVAGTYTILATVAGPSACTNLMTSSVSITINPLPTAYTVTGGGGYCLGGSGSPVGLVTSDAGINYQLYRGTTAVGSPVAGTGSAISFGLQTVGGTYTVKGTDATTGCVNMMSGSVIVVVNSLPYAFTITGGGSYCPGGAGVAIGLAGTTSSTTYQLYNAATPMGAPITGTGAGISFGLQTATGTYTIIATSTITGCTNTMTGSVTVSIASLPTAFTVTGGGGYCAGGAGLHVGLASSSTGVVYQLYRGASGVGSPLSGTGAPLDFGVFTTAGTYTVVATSVGALCTNNMTGSVTITINPLPTAYAVTGGGAYCTGGTGVAVGLANSQTGVNYQLYRGTTPVGSPVAGTGAAISFGLQTTAGSYGVVATDATTGCVSSMTGSVSVTIIALPTAYTITGGGGYCAGGTGMPIYLMGSQTGVNYQLYNGATPVGTPFAGTGAAISFGLQTAAGTYTVVATTAAGGCTNSMTGSAVITINAAPTAYTVTGGGSLCSGAAGVPVGLVTSSTGVNYQLYRGTTAVGSPVAGTGSAISFGAQTVSGTYTVKGTSTTGGCMTVMSGSVTVTVNSLPAVVSVTGGGGYCSGGAGVTVGLAASASGITYQLYLGGTPVGSPVSGTGLALSFGYQTAAGVYTVVATNAAGCTSTMSGSATVYLYTNPTVYTVSGGGGYCTGFGGVHIYLSGSNSGISYKLYRAGTPVYTMSGTGAAIDFGLYSIAGTYTIVATASGSGCTSTMSGSATVTVNPLPTVTGSIYTVMPGASITYTGSIAGGSWSSSNLAVATVGSGTGIITGVSIGTAMISYTLPTGCAGAHLVAVTATGHRETPGSATVAGSEVTGNVSVVPNPNKGIFTVKGSLATTSDVAVSILITDIAGRSIYSTKVTALNGELNEMINLGNVANGMYLLNVHSETTNKVFHLVVEQ